MYNHQGETSLQRGDYSDAIEKFTEAIKLLEPDGKPNPDAAWSYAHRGEARRLLGEGPGAEKDFKAAIDRKANYAYAYAHGGENYRTNMPFEKPEALKFLNEAVKLDNSYIWAVAHRGACRNFNNKDQLEEALQDFSVAIDMSGGTYAWALAFRSVVYLRKFLNELENTEPNKEKLKEYTLNSWLDFLNAVTLDPDIIDNEILQSTTGTNHVKNIWNLEI